MCTNKLHSAHLRVITLFMYFTQTEQCEASKTGGLLHKRKENDTTGIEYVQDRIRGLTESNTEKVRISVVS